MAEKDVVLKFGATPSSPEDARQHPARAPCPKGETNIGPWCSYSFWGRGEKNTKTWMSMQMKPNRRRNLAHRWNCDGPSYMDPISFEPVRPAASQALKARPKHSTRPAPKEATKEPPMACRVGPRNNHPDPPHWQANIRSQRVSPSRCQLAPYSWKCSAFIECHNLRTLLGQFHWNRRHANCANWQPAPTTIHKAQGRATGDRRFSATPEPSDSHRSRDHQFGDYQENYASSHKGIRENGKVRDMAVMPKINTDHKRGDRNRFQLGFKTTPKMLVPICATTSLISMTTNFVEEYGQQYARQWSWITISWRSTYEWRSCIVLRGGCTQWSLKRSKATQVGRANRLQICNLNWLLYGCVLPESRHHCSFLALIR